MSTFLGIKDLYALPQKIDWSYVNGLDKMIKIPDIMEEDLYSMQFLDEVYGLHPYNSLEEAIESFKKDINFYPLWLHQFTPETITFWPCDTDISAKEISNILRDQDIPCVYINGLVNNAFLIKGFSLTKAGNDQSESIAEAYISIGQIPPLSLLKQIKNTQNEKIIHAIQDAKKQIMNDIENLGIDTNLKNKF